MPFASFEGSPCANTSASFETEPLEIHIFRPRSTHESPSRFASLRIDCCSEVRSKSTRLLGRRALRGAFADREQRVDLADVPEAALEDAGRAAHGLRGRLVVRKGSEMLRERANHRVEIPNQLR